MAPPVGEGFAYERNVLDSIGGQMIYFKYGIYRIREKFIMWLVWRLPKRLCYWCGIRMCSHATTGEYSNTVVPELGMMDMLKRCEGWHDNL